MGTAALWGTVAASSLVIGALLALARDWPDRLVGHVLAFGAGALISAVSFELAEDGVEVGGGVAVGIGFAVGALTYFGLDSRLEGSGTNPATALALGAFLDGIPEQLVLGLGIAVGGTVGVGLIAAIFVSNLPEAIGSATEMRRRGRDGPTIMRLWCAVALVCAVSSLIGYALADSLSPELQGALNGFAAGALLVMLTDSMIPEARKAGRTAGLAVAFGFALAAGLSTVSS
jgi:zinc transporter, ZIP family